MNAKHRMLETAIRFMELRSELFRSRFAAAEYLGVTEDAVTKWERCDRRIPQHAWNQLNRLKEARAASRSLNAAQITHHPKE